MAISLKKGGSINLTKKEPGLKKMMIGLGWEMKPGSSLDLDASVFILGKNRKLIADEYFVFYNNLTSPDGAIQHTGDNRTGEGEGDDEMILANLEVLNSEVHEILVVVSIHEAEARGHHFGLLKDAYIRIVDVEKDRVILNYDLDESNPTNTVMEFGKLEKRGGEWHFVASGIGGNQGLQGLIDVYA